MNTIEFALTHNIPVDDFNDFLERTTPVPIKKNFWGDIIIPKSFS